MLFLNVLCEFILILLHIPTNQKMEDRGVGCSQTSGNFIFTIVLLFEWQRLLLYSSESCDHAL